MRVGCRELVGGGCGKEFAMVTRTMLVSNLDGEQCRVEKRFMGWLSKKNGA